MCSAIKKDVWEKLRFTDDVPMSEDKDFALKVLKTGYKIVYEPEATVYHSHDYSLRSLFKRRFQDGSAFSNIALEGESGFWSWFKICNRRNEVFNPEKTFSGNSLCNSL